MDLFNSDGNQSRIWDLVLAWHMSAAESDLSYLRFNGTSYQRISAATQLTDADGVQKIIPKRTP